LDTISHANVIPWLIDPSYLLQLVELAMLAVTSVTLAGLVYAGLHSLLSNRPGLLSVFSGGSLAPKASIEEVTCDEA
jgi:hypothetical protein